MSSGQLYLVSAPSGAGKTSMVRELIKKDENIKLSISHTTRAPRASERHAKDYFFVTKPEFEELLRQNSFLEHANVYGNYYGTSKDAVFAMLATGSDVILEIDWQGAQQIIHKLPDTIHISIAPPSIEALRSRLSARGLDDSATIEHRMSQAEDEIDHLKEAEYVVINDDFAQAVAAMHAIFIAERQKYIRQKPLLDKL